MLTETFIIGSYRVEQVVIEPPVVHGDATLLVVALNIRKLWRP